MFIELTDHLRCPADHDEQFLVLIPELMDGRDVRQGSLGCPVCHRSFPIRDGVATFGRSPATDILSTRLTADAQAALAGLGAQVRDIQVIEPSLEDLFFGVAA